MALVANTAITIVAAASIEIVPLPGFVYWVVLINNGNPLWDVDTSVSQKLLSR